MINSLYSESGQQGQQRTRQDLIAYHRSIAEELKSVQDRVRNLIGSRHWGTDGEQKEYILREALRLRMPESVAVDGSADRIEGIRNQGNTGCWCDLFIFQDGSIKDCRLLQELQRSCNSQENRIINCVCLGKDTFVHYWKRGKEQVGSPIEGPVWHSYHMANLATAYFISNMVANASPGLSRDEARAWFPIEQGKETQRQHYISIESDICKTFA